MSKETKRASVLIGKMHCASCALRIEKALQKVPGVEGANVNFANEKASITYDSSKTSEAAFE